MYTDTYIDLSELKNISIDIVLIRTMNIYIVFIDIVLIRLKIISIDTETVLIEYHIREYMYTNTYIIIF